MSGMPALSMGQPGALCVECLEKRLGRQLVVTDFTDAIVNSLSAEKSAKLRERMQ